ncbi:MAG: ion channel [Rhodomicrobium sp.]
MSSSTSQEVAILLPLLVSLATTLTTIAIHAIALLGIVRIAHHEYLLGRAGTRFWRDVAIVATVTQLALVAHVVEITIWAAVLGLCGEFNRFAGAFYHSAMNYTSLGYGDVVMSASWKLLGPLEAANGLLMFGVSTATIFALIQRLVQSRLGLGVSDR